MLICVFLLMAVFYTAKFKVLQDCLSLQNDLDQLSSWSKSWQLNFNVKKCYHLGITCKKFPTLFQYTLNGLHISKVNSTRYLGVTISSNLSWNTHVDNICKNADSTLGLLCRVLGGCSHKVNDMACRTLVRPKLNMRPLYGTHIGSIT